ncbi:MAG: hypothetical protein ACOC0X_05645 [Halobacteriota archaeon]
MATRRSSAQRADGRPTYRRTRPDAEAVRPEDPDEAVRFLEEELERRETELDRIIEHYETLLQDARDDRPPAGSVGGDGLADRLLADAGRSLLHFRRD